MKYNYATPTDELVRKFEAETNPVTRSVYRDIIAKRIGLAVWSTRARPRDQ